MRRIFFTALILIGTGALADSLNVRLLGVYDSPGLAADLAVSGNYAYIADYNGLVVVDISDPKNPSQTGYLSFPSNIIEGIAVSGDYAYLAANTFGLIIVNVADPANPAQVGQCATTRSARKVAVKGNYAYVADSDSGLSVIDISDKSTPFIVGHLGNLGYVVDIAVSEIYPYAYLAARADGLKIINISIPSNPGLAGALGTGYALGVVSSGDYIYVADEYQGLRVMTLSGGLHEIAIYDSVLADAADVSGNIAATVGRSPDGLEVFDVSDPSNPVLTGFYHQNWYCTAVEIKNDLFLVAREIFGLYIYQSPIPPLMEPNAGQHDFGSATAGDSLYWDGLFIRNIGGLPLEIDSLRFATGIFWSHPLADSTVAPGDSVSLTLGFSPPFNGRRYTDTLKIYSGQAENSLVKVALSGTGAAFVEVPQGTVPKFDGLIDPEQWADAYKDTFQLENKTGKYHNVDTFWVKYSGDTLYLAMITPDYAGYRITNHSLLFDPDCSRGDSLQSGDIRLMVTASGEEVGFVASDQMWVLDKIPGWRSAFSNKDHLVTLFAVALEKIGITPGQPDTVGLAILADGSDLPYGRWPAAMDSVGPVTWSLLTFGSETGLSERPPDNRLATSLSLSGTFPNPVKTSVEFRYQLSQPSPVKLRIYNIAGQLVKSFDQGVQVPGSHSINWNVQSLPSGVYLYRLEAGNNKATKRMLVIK